MAIVLRVQLVDSATDRVLAHRESARVPEDLLIGYRTSAQDFYDHEVRRLGAEVYREAFGPAQG